ncbi:MAG: peptidoglycan editing factor PgeF [Bdellovibrionales bacterium]|jgi:hypothetical protein
MSREILFADNLITLPNVRHAFFTRACGNICFLKLRAAEPEALSSRKKAAAHFGVPPERLLFCRQIHSPKVVRVHDIWLPENAPEADALVTNKAGIALAVLTADCVPVLLAATNVPVIGAAHAGWRGAIGGVLENTIVEMEKLGAQRKYIQAAIGPCIWKESYEVGSEFLAPFLTENPSNKLFFTESARGGHYQFNLPAYVEAKLKGLGIGSVEPSPADTCADSHLFYSYRASTLRGENSEGRLVSAIALI